MLLSTQRRWIFSAMRSKMRGKRFQISGFRLGRPAYAYASREIMAKHVVSLAQYGERDSIVLSDSAVDFLTTNYEA